MGFTALVFVECTFSANQGFQISFLKQAFTASKGSDSFSTVKVEITASDITLSEDFVDVVMSCPKSTS